MEAHPSHIVLEARAKREAYEAINWAMTGTLALMDHIDLLTSCLQTVSSAINYWFFLRKNVERCSISLTGSTVRLALFLHIYISNKRTPDDNNREVDTAIQTRTIARILLRVGELTFFHGMRD